MSPRSPLRPPDRCDPEHGAQRATLSVLRAVTDALMSAVAPEAADLLPLPAPDESESAYLGRLGRFLLEEASEECLGQLVGIRTPEHVALVERAVAEVRSVGWRANPISFAHHLTAGEFKLWRYSVLLGEMAREAVMGIKPHQMWALPSQMGKTRTLIWTALWALDRAPTTRIMYVSYDADRAVEEGGLALDIVRAHADEMRFKLRPDVKARGRWMTDQGGGLYCVGVGGAITGYAQDVLLLDDLVKGWEAAHSAANRERVFAVYRSQIRMRVQSSCDPIILCGTRWHEDDIHARLLSAAEMDPHADQWHVIRLPALAEEPNPLSTDPLLRLPDPLGRAPGEVIEPDRFPLEEVLARRASLGAYLSAALEQQRPAPVEGNEIKRDWFRLEEVMPERADAWLTSWDMKLKDKETGDYVVGQVWVRCGKDCWLLDQIRGQFGFAASINAVALLSVRWPEVRQHVIEHAGNGPEVIEALSTPAIGYEVSDDIAGALGMTEGEREAVSILRRRGLPGIIPHTPKGSKTVRMRAVSPYVEAGDVHLPARAQWVPAFLEEVAQFPHGAHDDMVDAMSQALGRIHRRGSIRRRPLTGEAQRAVAATAV